jgi:crotonobetainyl-CoA:carnitine CoA-transferase CaiB-like acyl-CoA transferase
LVGIKSAPNWPTRPSDPHEYATAQARSKNRDTIDAEINALTERKSTETCVRELNAAGVPCGPIYSSAGHAVENAEQNGGAADQVCRQR